MFKPQLAAKIGIAGLLVFAGLTGCQRRPDSFKNTAEPGDTIYFVPVREKVIALTFDDGPNEPATGMILDTLKLHQVKATFFLVGDNVARHPETARRIRNEGHLIGNHTARHSRFDHGSAADVAADITAGFQAIKTATGIEPRWFRPPYGINGPGMEAACRAHGMAIAGWSADANDWNPHPVEEIVDRIVAPAMPGDIVLLHDGRETCTNADRSRTVAAVPLILEQLKARGFRCVTLPELLRVAGEPVAEFANGVRLLGWQIPDRPVKAGDAFLARYFWDMPPGTEHLPAAAFVHFIAPDGSMPFQDDHAVVRSVNLHSLATRHAVVVPRQAAPGRYLVRIGMFDTRDPDIHNRVRVRSSLRQDKHALIMPGALAVNPAAEP